VSGSAELFCDGDATNAWQGQYDGPNSKPVPNYPSVREFYGANGAGSVLNVAIQLHTISSQYCILAGYGGSTLGGQPTVTTQEIAQALVAASATYGSG
jgi:hypothetical protein